MKMREKPTQKILIIQTYRFDPRHERFTSDPIRVKP